MVELNIILTGNQKHYSRRNGCSADTLYQLRWLEYTVENRIVFVQLCFRFTSKFSFVVVDVSTCLFFTGVISLFESWRGARMDKNLSELNLW